MSCYGEKHCSVVKTFLVIQFGVKNVYSKNKVSVTATFVKPNALYLLKFGLRRTKYVAITSSN